MQGGDHQKLELPAGFRFHPTDEELVVHYLCPKCANQQIHVPIIAEIDLYKFDPWQLPGMALYGEKEWYFFSPRDRKYPNGSRPNRAARSGYWKATGADKPVGKPKTTGIKKALVFYTGKAPRGIKTNWIMHEYRLANVDRSPANNKNNKNLRLDDWVLCRIYNKKGIIEKPHMLNHESLQVMEKDEQSPKKEIPYSAMKQEVTTDEHLRVDDTCESTPPGFHSESSGGSGQVLSPELYKEEVQSAPKWAPELDRAFEYQLSYMHGFQDDSFPGSQMLHQQYDYQFFQLQDMLMYMQKPF